MIDIYATDDKGNVYNITALDQLWMTAFDRGKAHALDQAAEQIKALPTGEGDGDGGAIIYDFRAMVLAVLAELRDDES